MPDVFVSHAAADKALAAVFVETLLERGCRLESDRILYTSRVSTGIPSGKYVLHHLGSELNESALVIAIISPTYQTRPVCIAELGAAWSRTDNLLPVMVPGMARTELDGILDGMIVRSLDDEEALEELASRLEQATGRAVERTAWGDAKRSWLRDLPRLAGEIPSARVVGEAELRRLEAQIAAIPPAVAPSAESRTSPPSPPPAPTPAPAPSARDAVRSASWSTVALEDGVMIVEPDGDVIAIRPFGKSGAQRVHRYLDGPLTDFVLADDGTVLVERAGERIVVADVRRNGDLRRWPTVERSVRGHRLLAVGRGGRNVLELLLSREDATVRLTVDLEGRVWNGPGSVGDARAAAALDDGFIVIDAAGALAGAPHGLAAAGEDDGGWIDVDSGTGGGTTLVAALRRSADTVALRALRVAPDRSSQARSLVVGPDATRVRVVRAPYRQEEPAIVVVQVGTALWQWAWDDLTPDDPPT